MTKEEYTEMVILAHKPLFEATEEDWIRYQRLRDAWWQTRGRKAQ